ncbi:MAG: hypothetical protein MHM6MM_000443 [Cercozoa sp. M6MM]
MPSTKVSTKRQQVADGVFHAELNDFLATELEKEGYAGVEVSVTAACTKVKIRVVDRDSLLDNNGLRINEITSLIQKRWGFKPKELRVFANKVFRTGLSAMVQCVVMRDALLDKKPVRRAAHEVLRNVLRAVPQEEGAKATVGAEVIVTGKLRGGRAKAMKFTAGYMIKSGDATNYYIDTATRHLNLPQGVIGIKIKIQLPRDVEGKSGPTQYLPDKVIIAEPKSA